MLYFARTARLCTIVRVEMQVKHIKVQPEAAKHITAAISKYRLKHRPFLLKLKTPFLAFLISQNVEHRTKTGLCLRLRRLEI